MIRIKKNKLDFKPKLIPTIVVILILPILFSLSYWQYARGIAKSHFFAQLEHNRNNSPMLFNDNHQLIKAIETSYRSIRFTKIKAIGTLQSKNFLLDNQIVNGVIGYRVITPFKLANTTKVILVDRGFIPKKFPLNELGNEIGVKDSQPNASSENSKPTALSQEITIYGIINCPVTGLVLKKDLVLNNPNWPIVIQSIDYPLLKAQLAQDGLQDSLAAVIQLDKDNPNTFEYVEPNFGITKEKHFSYAVQWFTLALTLVLYYLIVNIRVTKLNSA